MTMPAIMAGRRSRARTTRKVASATTKSTLSTRQSRSSFLGLADPHIALMTTAASTVSGSHWNKGAKKSSTSSTMPASRMFETCVLAPAASAAEDLERLPVTPMPPSRPAPMLPTP